MCVCVCATIKTGKSRWVRWTGHKNRTGRKNIEYMRSSGRDLTQIGEKKGGRGEKNFRCILQKEFATIGASTQVFSVKLCVILLFTLCLILLHLSEYVYSYMLLLHDHYQSLWESIVTYSNIS